MAGSVRVLLFYECTLAAEVLALFAGSAELQKLSLVRCPFTKEWVVDMAAVRNAPLTLEVLDPRLSPHSIVQCTTAAEQAHGAQYITFT